MATGEKLRFSFLFQAKKKPVQSFLRTSSEVNRYLFADNLFLLEFIVADSVGRAVDVNGVAVADPIEDDRAAAVDRESKPIITEGGVG
ncbi:MAG: hypothetical protein IJG32_02470, partial [Selenomonadaceae bacterium]|nr:hypothetical protein [Selenomonadaceae bacterium]